MNLVEAGFRFGSLRRSLELRPGLRYKKHLVKAVFKFCRWVLSRPGWEHRWVRFDGKRYPDVDFVVELLRVEGAYKFLADWLAKDLSKLGAGTLSTHLAYVKGWLEDQGIFLSRMEERRLKRLKDSIISCKAAEIPEDLDTYPSREQLRAMVKKAIEAGDYRFAFLILFLAESGCRPILAFRLKLSHLIDSLDEEKPCYAWLIPTSLEGKIRARGRKLPSHRPLFMGPDAAILLRRYLQQRRAMGEEITPDSPLLRFERGLNKHTRDYLNKLWRKYCREAGIGLTKIVTSGGGVIYLPRLYSLRKYWQSQAELAGIHPNIVNKLLGRTPIMAEGKSYSRQHLEELRQEYLKILSRLLIFDKLELDGKTYEINLEIKILKTGDEIRRELEERDRLIAQINEVIKRYALQVQAMNQRIQKLEEELRKFKPQEIAVTP